MKTVPKVHPRGKRSPELASLVAWGVGTLIVNFVLLASSPSEYLPGVLFIICISFVYAFIVMLLVGLPLLAAVAFFLPESSRFWRPAFALPVGLVAGWLALTATLLFFDNVGRTDQAVFATLVRVAPLGLIGSCYGLVGAASLVYFRRR